MAKSHLKRVSVPKTWNVQRKSCKFAVRTTGYLESSLPVALILKETLGLVKTRAESKKVVNNGAVSIDGKTVKNDRLPVGIMSVISVGGKDYRMLLDPRGKLFLKTLSQKESTLKLCRIISKTTLKGSKFQFGFHDGRTMMSDKKDFNINDTIAFKIPEFTVQGCLKFAKNSKAYLTGGSNVGRTGVIDGISGLVSIKIGGKIVEASKENVFIIGDESEMISVAD